MTALGESGLELPRIDFGIDVADSGLTIRLRRSVRGHLAAETPHRDSSGNRRTVAPSAQADVALGVKQTASAMAVIRR
jgi:hypothetical protein